jgi:hypothetical protein
VIVTASSMGCQCRAFPHLKCYRRCMVPSNDNAPGRTPGRCTEREPWPMRTV